MLRFNFLDMHKLFWMRERRLQSCMFALVSVRSEVLGQLLVQGHFVLDAPASRDQLSVALELLPLARATQVQNSLFAVHDDTRVVFVKEASLSCRQLVRHAVPSTQIHPRHHARWRWRAKYPELLRAEQLLV